MSNTNTPQNFLLEIGCEELPASAQATLPRALETHFSALLTEHKLHFEKIHLFSTPRRLAVIISGLQAMQAPQTIERQGPGEQEAYDKNGTPTLTCLGFAKSCGTIVDQLIVRDTPKGKRIVYMMEKPGSATKEILPEIVTKVIS